MKTKIIANDQITASSSIPGYEPRSSYYARLDNTNCWCADQSQSRNGQWVKVDLKHTFSVTGITIQGDPSGPSNYIKEFNLRYSVDLTNYVYVTTTTFNDPMVSLLKVLWYFSCSSRVNIISVLLLFIKSFLFAGTFLYVFAGTFLI